MATDSTRRIPGPSWLQELYERPLIRKFWKYSMTSVVGVVMGQSLIFLFASILDWSWGWANVAAVTISTVPTYYLSRAWVWQKHGKSSLYAEVIPFWVMTFLGLLLSTIAVVVLEDRYPDSKILANVGNVAGFGVLWLAKFFILDRLLFKVTHEHPEGPTPFLSSSTAMGRLDGKVALITGGARGQGAEEAKLFAAEGAQVVITDVLDADGKQTASDIGSAATFHHHDVTSETEWTGIVDAVLAEHGRLDVLVNNAGILAIAPLVMTTEEDYRRVIDVNQIGVFLGMKAVVPHMVERQQGSIINISSVAGLMGSPGMIAYGASKWAVRGMTKSVALEVAPFGVRVNSIHPGIIDTPMLEEFEKWGIMGSVMERVPVGRTAEAVEVAQLALYLASDDSRYSTGSEFVVDGGMTAS